jgi:hypothetical protein
MVWGHKILNFAFSLDSHAGPKIFQGRKILKILTLPS